MQVRPSPIRPTPLLRLLRSIRTTNSNPQEANQIRVLASGKGINVNALGDVGVLPVVNSNRWNVQAVVATNLTAMPARRLLSRFVLLPWELR